MWRNSRKQCVNKVEMPERNTGAEKYNNYNEKFTRGIQIQI